MSTIRHHLTSRSLAYPFRVALGRGLLMDLRAPDVVILPEEPVHGNLSFGQVYTPSGATGVT